MIPEDDKENDDESGSGGSEEVWLPEPSQLFDVADVRKMVGSKIKGQVKVEMSLEESIKARRSTDAVLDKLDAAENKLDSKNEHGNTNRKSRKL